MKKFVVGVVVGAALTLSVTAAADSISFVGKKVTSQTEVYLDGKLFDSAPVIDGTSLAPLRKAYETAGYKVTYKDGKVYLESDVSTTETEGEESVNENNHPTTPEEADLKIIEGQIDKTGLDIQTQRVISNPENGFSKEEQEAARAKIPELEAKLKELNTKLTALNSAQ
ncbi:hypothetical protein ACFOQM_23225 [Paenibacillus sp. GCM10012307]|uniref:Copper amine oxidase-like N-terminal domain-containing protein n=1 Tax=Paenibacillus roseus TaxID=2798579 RepID=A0A934MXF7_9BACL|nr:hypothetical protein [Paenibacillus roseus]MBJ6364137.1 hypothetical protein [Paenibacillus roseus]